MRILACGNCERADDGAGILVGERLQALGVDVQVESGEALSLIEAWSGADEVIVIDAVLTGARAGTVHIWENPRALPVGVQASSHGFGVAEAVELARALGRLPRRLRIFGIEGKEFQLGSNVSPEVMAGVDEIARLIEAQLPLQLCVR